MERLVQTAVQIGLYDLSQHLPIPNTGDEVQHVAEVFNSLLRRIEGQGQAFTHPATLT